MYVQRNYKGQVRICSLQLGLANFGWKEEIDFIQQSWHPSQNMQQRDRIIVGKVDNESKDTYVNNSRIRKEFEEARTHGMRIYDSVDISYVQVKSLLHLEHFTRSVLYFPV